MPKPLRSLLTKEQYEAITDPEASAALFALQKEELEEAHAAAGAFHLRAITAEKALVKAKEEVERLNRQLEGVKKANITLNTRCNGPQPIEVAR
jgi:hypothetical protein